MTKWLRQRWIPFVVAFSTLAVGALVFFLLQDARQGGVESLRGSLLAEVSATARSQDQRVRSGLAGGTSLAGQPWDFEVGSTTDEELLTDLLQFVPDLRTGFIVTDPSLRITQGVNLEDPSIIGEVYERPGTDDVLRSESFRGGAGLYLPMSPGVTADLPTIAAVIPILDPVTFELRGTFVFESEVAVDSDFNEEIGELGRGETGEFLFYDSLGSVIAASDPSLIAATVPDPMLLTDAPGLRSHDGKVVVIQDVPSAGWRVAFRQDLDEFQSGLVGPLQSVGELLALAFVALGFGLFLLFAHRLRVARDEQARLQQLAASQEEFISIVSHELRTPVSGVLGFLQTTLDHWDTMSDSARRSAVERSASNARRLQSLARDVLDSEAVESGRMTFSMANGDLVHEVRVAIDAARDAYPEHRVVLDTAVDAAPVVMDVDRIQQVLGNLLDNAARLSPSSEPLEVSIERTAETTVVSVRDHGPGLAPEGAERIFDRFNRGETGAVSGTGLGLYIARQIVEAHEGTITVRSAVGAGATFIVTLPSLSLPSLPLSDSVPSELG
ncbi:sensor histidine kinase [Actinospongicola halichondriae]|uniref:sensor histidine kinase n=1 Tax=Actinospongicola halichondriae TaxID=3236844 RepID=UPI003D4EE1AB